MKAEKKEPIIDIRLTRVDANEDWSEDQRGDAILTKFIAAKEKDKRPYRNEISSEGLTKAYMGKMGQLKPDKQVLIPSLGKR